ncbi:hypothetical protein G1K53_11485 [Tenacibaculum finnmarkense]|uniref:hypothetical protein n=1 Tax=Tenacibaculum finnmarkense TaxID=2781243 RepID=UPI001EFB8AE3|nr:hypothetical protein [Tenacibaculum finnmarkense]MCG8208131.1 hypothetical protein [Tenacibaculum finnmarkense genomovar finnmarkense]MCG8742459.1 hypothetical protein [Tenacibaculum finnmarkense]MCG8765860.1 hypothetical protein [Tenacibaculum finnmarkense]MCM8907267.1 hypothetical protein [Tenacibaculum finnmarkense genomovar finnmarkense]
MSRKVETTHLQVKSVKNAKVLGTDKDGFVIESDLDFLNYIPKDGAKGAKGDTGAKGSDANSIDLQAGTNITIDKTNPLKPVINANVGSSGGGTDLSYTLNKDKGTIKSSTGNNTHIPLASNAGAGLMKFIKGTIKGKVKHRVTDSKGMEGVYEGNVVEYNRGNEDIDIHYTLINGICYFQIELHSDIEQTKMIKTRVQIEFETPFPISIYSGKTYITGSLNISEIGEYGFLRADDYIHDFPDNHVFYDKAITIYDYEKANTGIIQFKHQYKIDEDHIHPNGSHTDSGSPIQTLILNAYYIL